MRGYCYIVVDWAAIKIVAPSSSPTSHLTYDNTSTTASGVVEADQSLSDFMQDFMQEDVSFVDKMTWSSRSRDK